MVGYEIPGEQRYRKWSAETEPEEQKWILRSPLGHGTSPSMSWWHPLRPLFSTAAPTTGQQFLLEAHLWPALTMFLNIFFQIFCFVLSWWISKYFYVKEKHSHINKLHICSAGSLFEECPCSFLLVFLNEWKLEVPILTSWNAEKLFHSLISLLTLPLKLCFHEQTHNYDLPRAAIPPTPPRQFQTPPLKI